MEDVFQILASDENGEIRIDVLRKLGEQAMTDLDFRAVARDDLPGALQQYGYELNPKELELALRFRDAVAEAGVDVFLQENFEGDLNDALAQLLS